MEETMAESVERARKYREARDAYQAAEQRMREISATRKLLRRYWSLALEETWAAYRAGEEALPGQFENEWENPPEPPPMDRIPTGNCG